MSDQGTDLSNSYDLMSPAFYADPLPTLARMRDADPVYWHPLLRCWVLTRYDDIVRVLRDPGTTFSAKRVEQYGVGAPESVQEKLRACNQFFATWVSFVDPPHHTRLRGLISKALTVQAIERLRPDIEARVAQLLAGPLARGHMDALAEFTSPLPLLLFSHLMGIPEGDVDRLKQLVSQSLRVLGAGIPSAEDVEVSHAGMLGFIEYFDAQIAERRRRPTEDMLSKLIEARVGDAHLSDTELVGMAVTLMLGGHETTANTIANGLYALLRHPDQMQKLRADLALVDGAVEEMLRYESPTFATFRRAVVDTEEIGGRKIAAGDFVCGVLLAANHDPRRFAEPARFDIERPDNRHLSFSGGVHTCPGAALARLESRIAVRALLEATRDIQLAIEAPEWLPNMMMRGVRELPIRLTPA